MVRDGEMAIREMKRLMRISRTGISADIVRLEQVSARIFDEVRTHSGEAAFQIRRFLDYYPPTTLKLLNAYDRMSGTGVLEENIDNFTPGQGGRG